jgi:hypothetical protein
MLSGSDDDTWSDDREGHSLPAPSHRQIWVTAVLVGILLVVGIVLLVAKSDGSSTSSINPVSGAVTTLPGTGTLPIGSPHSGGAVALELSIRSKVGGCWDDAEPGGADGAYRQDYHFAAGHPCGGEGWDVDVELFDSNGKAVTAASQSSRSQSTPAHSTPAQSTYRAGNMVVILAPAAGAGVRTAVASQPGLSPVSP